MRELERGASIGPYEVLGNLGQGGMGAVYEVRHRDNGLVRALKIMGPHDERSVARFRREVDHLAQARHPNVVAIHECGVADEHPYFVMDRVEGTPLRDLLERERLPWRQGLELSIAMARGVAALHDAGVVHRDLKPDNIMVTASGEPIVIDLGLAVAPERDERLTRSGTILGTFSYMAPEQLEGGAPAPTIDVYALGLILFEVLTGTPVVPQQRTVQAASLAILEGCSTPPSRLEPGLPRRVDVPCLRALAREPDRRQSDAGALADELQAVLDDPGGARRSLTQLLAAAGVLMIVLAVILILATSPAEPDSPPVSDPEPSPSPAPEPSASDPAHERAGLKALRSLRLEQDPRRKHARAASWLKEYPEHSRTAEVRTLRHQASTEFPRLVLQHPGLVAAHHLGDRIVTASGNGSLRSWDPATGAELNSRRLGWSITALAPEPGGRSVLVGGVEGELAWVELATGKTRATRSPFGWTVRALAFAPGGAQAAVGGDDPHVRLVWMSNLQEQRRFGPHGAPVHAVTFTPAGLLATACGLSLTQKMTHGGRLDQAARLWKLTSSEPIHEQRFMGKATCLAASRRTLAVGTSVGRVFLLSARSGRSSRELVGTQRKGSLGVAHPAGLTGVAFSPDGKRLYSVSGGVQEQTHEIKHWQLEPDREQKTLVGHVSYRGVDVSPDGRDLLVGVEGKRAEVWILPH